MSAPRSRATARAVPAEIAPSVDARAGHAQTVPPVDGQTVPAVHSQLVRSVGGQPVGSAVGEPGRSADPQIVPPVDLRLVPPALGVWIATCLALRGTATVAVLVCLALAVITVVSFLVGRSSGWSVVSITAGCAAAALLAVAPRLHARESSPLAHLARDRVVARISAVVTGDPHLIAAGGMVLVPVRVTRVAHGRDTWRLDDSAIVLADTAGWADVLPSQSLVVYAQLQPGYRSDLTTAVISARGPPEEVGHPSTVQRVAGRLRAGLRQAAQGLPDGARGLLPGLVDGDTNGLDPALAADFQTASLTHLTAVSGANCGILCGAVLFVLRLLRCGPRLSAAAAGAALLGFVILARPQPSVVRAAIMCAVALTALASGRAKAVVPALAATVIGLTIVSPTTASTPAFAMSVAATAALVLIAPGWASWLQRIGVPGRLALPVAIAAAAQVASAPLIAAVSGQVSLVGVPANVLAEPAVAPATVLGVLAAALAPLSMPAATTVAWCAGWPTRWIVAVARWCAQIPGAQASWPAGTRGAVLLALALLAACVAVRSARLRRAALVVGIGIAVVAGAAHLSASQGPPGGWQVIGG